MCGNSFIGSDDELLLDIFCERKLESLSAERLRILRAVLRNRWNSGLNVAREPAIIPRPASMADHSITGVEVAGVR